MTKSEQQTDEPSVWEPTKYQRLFRYVPWEVIFARFKIAGKLVRKSLNTLDVELAKTKLTKLERKQRAIAHEQRRGRMLLEEARDEHRRLAKARSDDHSSFLELLSRQLA
jgi:hypothetical protein